MRFAPRTATRKKRAIVRADAALSVGSGSQPRQRDTMNASDPPRQMALIGKASADSDFGQPGPPFANKLERTLQSEVHDVAMRCHTNRIRRWSPRNRKFVDSLLEGDGFEPSVPRLR